MKNTIKILGLVVAGLSMLLLIFEFGSFFLSVLRTRLLIATVLVPTAGLFVWCVFSILKNKPKE